MSFADLFKAKENEQLKNRVADLEALLTPEILNYESLCQKVVAHEKMIIEKESRIKNAEKELDDLDTKILDAKKLLVETNEEVLMQSFGLYEPKFDFANSTKYKEALSVLRAKQKECIKMDKAAFCPTNWTVDGDSKKGAKMVADMKKLLIRAFNCECDDAIEHVKFNNIEAAEKKILSSFNALCKLGSADHVSLTKEYYTLKLNELYMSYEYQLEKQKEKEELKLLRAEERERAKLEKEIAEARKKIEKDQKHFANALKKINEQIKNATPDEIEALEERKKELTSQLSNLDESMAQINYREANQKAGYVYIISNIGAFGENVYKIGMTRRLDPMDRIDELGDASVPFDFDVHALIFSDNAPALEAALHKAFEDRKLNMVNTRREFFRVSLDEIKDVIKKNFDNTVDFVDVPLAEQFRQSELLRQ